MKRPTLKTSAPALAALIMLFSILAPGFKPSAALAQGVADPNCWNIYPATRLGYSKSQSQLAAIAVGPQQPGAPSDVWAVGYSTGYNPYLRPQPTASHWNGAQWSSATVPQPENTNQGALSSVAVIAPNDVWAVGYAELTGDNSVGALHTLLAHWNGSAWSNMPAPNRGGLDDNLTLIAATADDDIWLSGDSISPAAPVVMHWNGSAWSQMILPPLAFSGAPTSLIAIARNDVWLAAGELLHWDGRFWSKFGIPGLTDQHAQLQLTARASNDVWAVGGAGNLVTGHWDGGQWHVLPSFDLNAAGGQPAGATAWVINSIAATAANELWAGGYHYQRNSPQLMFLLRWDGSQWSFVSMPVNRYSTAISALAADAGSVWAAGSGSNLAVNNTAALVLRHDSGACANSAPAPIQPLEPPVVVPGSGSASFPETQQTVSGVFLQYWQQHGGLMQQGYPISPVIGEVSDLNGKTYSVQYFERAVFEYHPENGAPYDVLLSQLGKFEYRQKYPTGAPNQQPNNESGSIFFPQTGKRLSGSFLAYWQANGGLMQQGYPLSDEFTEVNELDGKPYTVQYFERAVFEYHPEYAKPYDVLLSHLGRFQYNAKYVNGSGPAETPLIARNVQPISSAGSYSFWVDSGHPQMPLLGYNAASKETFEVSPGSGNDYFNSLASDGVNVVWIDLPSKSIKGMELASRRSYTILSGLPDDALSIQLALDGGTLYRTYAIYTPSIDTGISARDLASGQERTIVRYTGPAPATPGPGVPPQTYPPNIYHLAAANGLLAWGAFHYGNAPGVPTTVTLHALRPDGSLPDTLIASNSLPDVHFSLSPDGQYIAYAFAAGEQSEWSSPALRLSLYTVSDRSDRVISDAAADSPVFANGKVAWVEGIYVPLDQQPHTTLKVYDPLTSAPTTVLTKNSRLAPVAIPDARTLLYTDTEPETLTANLYRLALR